MRLCRIVVICSIAAPFFFGFFSACTSSGLYQGDEYTPNGTIAIAPATERTDAASCSDGSSNNDGSSSTCSNDSGARDVVVLPLPDGSTEPTNTCTTARAIGTISGDTGASSATAKGTCSEWLSVRVTEDDSSALGAGMKTTITLTPSGGDFELYVYFNPDRDVLACSAPFASSFNTGTAVETINLAWGEGGVANGADDGRTIGIAVIKAADGPCSASTSWSLKAEH